MFFFFWRNPGVPRCNLHTFFEWGDAPLFGTFDFCFFGWIYELSLFKNGKHVYVTGFVPFQGNENAWKWKICNYKISLRSSMNSSSQTTYEGRYGTARRVHLGNVLSMRDPKKPPEKRFLGWRKLGKLFYSCRSKSSDENDGTLRKTNSSHLPGSHLKRKFHLPTIHFQVLLLFVSGG